ncbi:MAG: cyclic nucleotide-binding domain-containing protein [Deltaproteobacteria bacterium]|nr:cyclic nucleotide-binding domain-containing protein [Deltaproteobacteria bacterium]
MSEEQTTTPLAEARSSEPGSTTWDRAREAANAEIEGRLEDAIAAAAEVIRATPEDLDGRRLGARLLARLGGPEGNKGLLDVAAAWLSRGYPLAALGALKDILDLGSMDARVEAALRELHARVLGKASGRVHVPRPGIPTYVGGPVEDALAVVLGAIANPPPIDSTPAESGPLPPFSEVGADAFLTLVRTLAHRRFSSGGTLVNEGDAGSSLFVLVHGSVEVSRMVKDARVTLARLGPGAILGEMSLVASQRRGATVTAIEPTELFEIDRPHVEEVAAAHPAFTEELVRFARRRMIGNLLATSPLFRGLGEQHRHEILRSFGSKIAREGEVLIAEGSEPIGLFLVASGEVQISKSEPDGGSLVLAHLREGEVFGEISLIDDSRTTASAVATQRTVLLTLGRGDFQRIRDAHPGVRAYLESLGTVRKLETERVMADGETLDADDLILV